MAYILHVLDFQYTLSTVCGVIFRSYFTIISKACKCQYIVQCFTSRFFIFVAKELHKHTNKDTIRLMRLNETLRLTIDIQITIGEKESCRTYQFHCIQSGN